MLTDILKNMLSPIASITETLGTDLTSPSLWESLGGNGSASLSGETVSHDGALDLAAVWQAVATISGDVGGLPLNYYKNLRNGSREIASKTKIDFIVSEEWNAITPAIEGWRRLMVHALLWGNGYAMINRASDDRESDIRSLINIHPEAITPTMDGLTDKMAYLVRTSNEDGTSQDVFFHDYEILHVKGISIQNGVACDWLDHARDTLGIGMAMQRHNSKFFANGMQLGGILMIPPTMTQEAKDNLEQGWVKRQSDPNNAFKVAILRDGAKYQPIVAKPEEAQMKEAKEENVREVARFFNLPGAKLNLVDSVSYNSTEQLQLIYLTTTLRHWLSGVTSECNMKLRSKRTKERKTHDFEYDVAALLKTDAKTQEEILQLRRNGLIITTNEYRDAISMPRSNDPEANKLFNPNTRDTSASGKEDDEKKPDPVEEDEPEKKEEEKESARFGPLVQNTLFRAGRKAMSQVIKLAKKPNKLIEWVDGDQEESRAMLREDLDLCLAACRMDEHTDDLTDAFFTMLVAELQVCLDGPNNDLPGNLDILGDSMETSCSVLTDALFSATINK